MNDLHFALCIGIDRYPRVSRPRPVIRHHGRAVIPRLPAATVERALAGIATAVALPGGGGGASGAGGASGGSGGHAANPTGLDFGTITTDKPQLSRREP